MRCKQAKDYDVMVLLTFGFRAVMAVLCAGIRSNAADVVSHDDSANSEFDGY